MTGPSSTPRGERAGTPGTRWSVITTTTTSEQVVHDDTPDPPRPNRATRRALARAIRKAHR